MMHNDKKKLQYRRDVLSDHLRNLREEEQLVIEELRKINKELKEHHGVLQR